MNLSLIHAHFLQNGFIGAAFKNLLAIPLIVTAHGGEVYDLPFRNSWYENLARYVLSEADAIITVSQFNAKKLSSLGISSYNLHVIPNGYDEKLFKPVSLCEARKKVGLPLSKKILLSVGNLVDIKGHTYLVDAMKIVAKRRHDTILVVVGTGSLKENLQRKARKLSLNGKILFIGEKEHREIPLWMNACDLFVLPSLGEGFPTVIPEAMACGKPIIGTSVGGVPEAISSNELGTLVPSRDSEALSQAILEGLNCEWSQEEILNKAKNYSWNSIIKQILAVYDKVLLKNNLHFNATSAVAT
jgi:glycosyltransferase involved in cell wall biosynthesis